MVDVNVVLGVVVVVDVVVDHGELLVVLFWEWPAALDVIVVLIFVNVVLLLFLGLCFCC